jgi:hypothetical protein
VLAVLPGTTTGIKKLEIIQNVDRRRVMENNFLARPAGGTAQITRGIMQRSCI